MSPIYEYKCSICGNETTVIGASIHDDKTMDCPDCGASAERKFSTYAAPGTRKQWLGKNQVNFDVDTPREEIQKQLRAAENAGKFSNDIKPHVRKERLRVGKDALKTAADVRMHE